LRDAIISRRAARDGLLVRRQTLDFLVGVRGFEPPTSTSRT
jgi:hypothetical protein